MALVTDVHERFLVPLTTYLSPVYFDNFSLQAADFLEKDLNSTSMVEMKERN